MNVEDLSIYKQYIELIYYTEMILEKYPKCERLSLVTNIKNNTYEGMKYVISAFKSYSKGEKMDNLNRLDTNFKMLKVLIRVSFKRKYINSKNYGAWSKKISNLCNLLGGWMKSCQKL